MFNNLVSVSTISNVLSLINSLFCVFSVYKYHQTNNNKWLRYSSYMFLIYLLIDFSFDCYIGIIERSQYILHHLISIIFIIWGVTFNFVDDNLLQTFLKMESSTLLLSTNILIKNYLDFTSKNEPTFLTSVLNKISIINYICFLPLFIYVRFYQFFKNVVFNLDVYVRLLSPTTNNLFYINRIIFLFLIGFIIINLYWLVLIFKNTFKKIKGFINPNKKNNSEHVTTETSVDEKPITTSKEVEIETPITINKEVEVEKPNISETNLNNESVTTNEQLDKSNLNKE